MICEILNGNMQEPSFSRVVRTDSRATPFTRAESGKHKMSVPGGTPLTMTRTKQRSVCVTTTEEVNTAFLSLVLERTSDSVVGEERLSVSLCSVTLSESAGVDDKTGAGVTEGTSSEEGGT